LFYFVLPIVGLVVVLDGLVRFGYHVLRRDESGNEWMRAMARVYGGHVILCGLGRVGLRILEQLLQLGEDVVVLEKDPENPNAAFAKKNGIPVLIGSGREEGIFDDLNVAQAKSIILATDDDLANLEMALDARKAKPEICVVMRMFDQELASKIREAFDIHLAFSTASQSAPLFATSSSDPSIINSFYVGSQLLVVANLDVNQQSGLIGKTIREVGTQHRIFFLSHTRGGEETHFPSGDTELQPGDRIVVQSEPKSLKLLHEWNGDQ
jgi:Trk K+ transport system NAD-binding subunit